MATATRFAASTVRSTGANITSPRHVLNLKYGRAEFNLIPVLTKFFIDAVIMLPKKVKYALSLHKIAFIMNAERFSAPRIV